MKVRIITISFLLICSTFMVMVNISQRASAQTQLLNDKPVSESALGSNEYQFEVLAGDHSVIGIRPNAGDNFDIEVFTDTTFTTSIESSTSIGDAVDFVVLDKTTWTSPPNRGGKITSGATRYIAEMENDIDDHTILDTWSGTMDTFPGNPVLDIGPPGSWDNNHVYGPTIVHDGTIYHMWYIGDDGSNRRIGHATSQDGITLIKDGANPVLTPGPSTWEGQNVGHPTVLYNGAIFQMWYGGSDGSRNRIGYATSPDGITWTKHPSNPVLDVGPSGSWEDHIVTAPTVLYDGTTYQMWYHGHDYSNYRIGYATSPDGITWTKSPANPVLNLGTPGSWEDTHVNEPMVFYNGAIYQMWFRGHDGTNSKIGHATSTDGISWTKNLTNPVLDLSSAGHWDDTHMGGPTVLYDGETYHMWFSGHDGSNRRIGYANSTDGVDWIKLLYAEVLDAYELTGMISGLHYSINLDAPTTLDLDLFIFDTTGGRDDAVASSTNTGVGIEESISFTAPTSGDYLLVITNENGGTGTYSVIANQPPIADAGEDQIVYEGDMVEFDGSNSFDPDGTIDTYEWDFNDDGIYDSVSTEPNVNHTWGDDYTGIVELRVTDNGGLSAIDICNITVLNIDPTVSIESVMMDVEIGLRVAGRKFNDVGMTLYEDGNQKGYISIERMPGSPDAQMAWIPITFNMTKTYNATITYKPEDPPNIGANPVWIYIRFENGTTEKIHHTFNVQQSMKRNSEHWNHVEPWEVDLNECLIGHPFEITSHITDPGSDDEILSYTYGSQIIIVTYLNNPPNPDPYPSPELNPVDIINGVALVYEGAGTLSLLVEDDDGGTTFETIDLV